MTIQTVHRIDDEVCRSFQAPLELIGKRWNSAILLALSFGATRFSEVVSSIEGLSDRMLAQRLRELEMAGLVTREVIATTPVQIRYELTPRGADLMAALQPITGWSQRWNSPVA